MKETIALIGKMFQRVRTLQQLGSRYRLLLVTQEEVFPFPEISNPPEVEVIYCAKEGCWEADMIMLAGEEIQSELLEKIREVATQKIVMVIHPADVAALEKQYDPFLVREALPFSKVVEVSLRLGKAVITGNDLAAVSTVEEVVQSLGYFVKN